MANDRAKVMAILEANKDKSFVQRILQNGNFIEFDDPKQADWFSKNYKKAWDGEGAK